MPKIIRTIVLVSVLACSTYAGEIQNPITSPPPATAQGDIQNGITETALSILGVMLSLI